MCVESGDLRAFLGHLQLHVPVVHVQVGEILVTIEFGLQLPGSLDVLVGVRHVQACPNVFSVFLWGEDDIAAPVSLLIS